MKLAKNVMGKALNDLTSSGIGSTEYGAGRFLGENAGNFNSPYTPTVRPVAPSGSGLSYGPVYWKILADAQAKASADAALLAKQRAQDAARRYAQDAGSPGGLGGNEASGGAAAAAAAADAAAMGSGPEAGAPGEGDSGDGGGK